MESVTSANSDESPHPASGTDQSVYSAPLSDAEYLKQCPLAHSLRGQALLDFRDDALAYRAISEDPEFQSVVRKAKRLIGDKSLGKSRGMFRSRLRSFFVVTNHPKDWKKCIFCQGTGQQAEGLGNCDKCKGFGYVNG